MFSNSEMSVMSENSEMFSMRRVHVQREEFSCNSEMPFCSSQCFSSYGKYTDFQMNEFKYEFKLLILGIGLHPQQ